MKLLLRAAVKGLSGIICLGLLLFLPAGTFQFPGAWRLMAILFIPMLVLGAVMFFRSPELLEKRLGSNEKNDVQKIVILLSALLFVAVFLLSSFDFRFNLSQLSTLVSVISSAVFLVGYGIYVEVMRENAYLSRTVEVQEGQKVIDTGLYGIIRHPMYLSTLLIFISMPLVLGSLYAFLLMLVFYPPIIVCRIHDEEKTLARELTGYNEYMKRVKYRVIPFIF